MKILIVDDDKDIVELLSIYVKNEGYEVERAYNGKEAITKLNTNPDIGLMILDIMMPQMDGLAVVREVRKDSQIPVLMLSAKTDDLDKIQGLIQGADDYVTKPFNILELKARIRALLRRAGGPAAQTPQRAPLLTVGDLSLDTEERVAIRDGKTIDLTAKEYDLIELLMKNPRRVYSRESLMDLVWGYSYAGDYRTVDVHIRRLREKLEPDPARPVHIMTKWGVGYYFKGESQPTV